MSPYQTVSKVEMYEYKSSTLYSPLFSHTELIVDFLFNVLPIVCGSSVFVFVLICITVFSF